MYEKIFFSVVFGVLFSFPAYGCLNGDTKELANGEPLYQDYYGYVPYGHEFGGKERLNILLLSLKQGYQKNKDVDYLSDQGYVLILLGKYQEAIDLYKNIELTHPNRYSTASNMGTAYELIGNNKEALEWIQKSVKISSKSHFYSEWIHVNILKAKIKGEKHVTSNSLIEQDFGKGNFPKTTLAEHTLKGLREQIYYQLNERMSFVEPKDKIVAQLLFDLGNISYLLKDKEGANEVYELSKEYGFDDPILEKRQKLYSILTTEKVEKKIITEVKFQAKSMRRHQLMGIFASVLALIFSGLIIFTFRKKIILMLK